MQRLKSTWMALMAGALLVTLSVSAAFGAAPTGEEGNRGQSIAAFVHELVFGNDDTEQDADEELVEDEDELSDADELADDDTLDEELDGDLEGEVADEDEELTDEEAGEEFDSHGACVSAAAQDREGSAESELKNHGEWVSQHARYTCWGLEVPTDEDEETTDEDAGTEDASVESDDDAGKADKADRGSGKPSWAGSQGGGNGRGGNRR